MKYPCFFFIILFSPHIFAQLSFCEGSKGDPIFHEDFGSGDTSGPPLTVETTNYQYVVGDPEDGQYTISNTIGNQIGGFHSFLPNTTVSNDKALIVNADFAPGLFYTIEIPNLCENTSYEFSAYLMNIYNRASNNCANGGIPINVRFQIWDASETVLIKEGSTGNIPSTSTPVWEQYALTFQSPPGQESVILKMFNNGDGGCGNDLAIDDIMFRSCGDFTGISSSTGEDSPLVVCEENTPSSFTLQATPDFSVYDQHAYQWQQSNDATSWVDLVGENSHILETPLLSSTTYYRVKVAEDAVNLTSDLCSSASNPYYIEFIDTPAAPQSLGDIVICGEEAIPALRVEVASNEQVSWYDAPQGGNLLAQDSNNFIPVNSGTYYARAQRRNYTCAEGPFTAVSLKINEIPQVQDEVLELCDTSPLILDAGVEEFQYIWSTGETSKEITVMSAGNYTVTLITPDGCRVDKDFEVTQVPIAGIEKITSTENSVTITPLHTGEFEYSVNGIDFQASNEFPNLRGGIYTAFVRDLLGCKTVSLEFPHIVVAKYFSPNNDGFNDFFELRGASYFRSSYVNIFDRYGKLLFSGKGPTFKWDGTFNGRPLPAGDYWYEIFIEDYDRIKGNVSLLR